MGLKVPSVNDIHLKVPYVNYSEALFLLRIDVQQISQYLSGLLEWQMCKYVLQHGR